MQLNIYQRCLLFQDDIFVVLKTNVMVKVTDFIHQYQHWLCSILILNGLVYLKVSMSVSSKLRLHLKLLSILDLEHLSSTPRWLLIETVFIYSTSSQCIIKLWFVSLFDRGVNYSMFFFLDSYFSFTFSLNFS